MIIQELLKILEREDISDTGENGYYVVKAERTFSGLKLNINDLAIYATPKTIKDLDDAWTYIDKHDLEAMPVLKNGKQFSRISSTGDEIKLDSFDSFKVSLAIASAEDK